MAAWQQNHYPLIMKNILAQHGETGFTAFFPALKAFLRYCRLPFLSPQSPPLPALSSREQMLSVDTFGFSQSKWGWNYTRDALTGNYFPHEAFPFCPRCEVPMQHQGNPFLKAFCPTCEAHNRYPYFQVLQTRSFVLAEVNKRYPIAGQTPDSLGPNIPDMNQEAEKTNLAGYQKAK
jgi:hypothetical protein